MITLERAGSAYTGHAWRMDAPEHMTRGIRSNVIGADAQPYYSATHDAAHYAVQIRTRHSLDLKQWVAYVELVALERMADDSGAWSTVPAAWHGLPRTIPCGRHVKLATDLGVNPCASRYDYRTATRIHAAVESWLAGALTYPTVRGPYAVTVGTWMAQWLSGADYAGTDVAP